MRDPHRPCLVGHDFAHGIQHPAGRRDRSLRLVIARGRASLALRRASCFARRLSPDRASCAAKVARNSDTILSIAPESWFDLLPFARIFGELTVANRTTLEPHSSTPCREHGGFQSRSPPYQHRYALPRGLTARTSITRSASRRSKITRHSPTRSRHKRSAPRSSLTSPAGSSPIAALIRSRSRRPSRRRDFNAAGQPSVRLSQRLAPPRPQTKGRQARSAPAGSPVGPSR